MAALPGLPRYCQCSAVNDLLHYVLKKAAAPSFWCCQLISPGVTRLARTCLEPSSGVVWVLHSHRRHADMVAGALIPGVSLCLPRKSAGTVTCLPLPTL